MKHCSIRFFALIAVWLVAGCATTDRWTSRPQAPTAQAHRPAPPPVSAQVPTPEPAKASLSFRTEEPQALASLDGPSHAVPLHGVPSRGVPSHVGAPAAFAALHQVEGSGGGSGVGWLNPLSVRGGLGFTLDPDTFLLSFAGDYALSEQFSLGPLLQLGLSGDDTIVAPTLNAQYSFDLHGMGPELSRLNPFVQGGLGFAFIHEDLRFGEDDDLGFLFNLGFGVEYDLTDRFALGNNLLFNIMPDEVNQENFFFSWQFATIRFRF